MTILICVLALWLPVAMRVSADGVVIARCKNEYDLSDTQRAMCLRQPELIPVIEGAEEAAREACGQQFRNDRWNCSGFNFLKTEQSRRYATRETSFMYAVMAVAVTKHIGQACRAGALTSCSCGARGTLPASNSETQYFWGCSESIQHGLKVSEQFLDAAERDEGVGLREQVHLRNLKAGRVLLEKASENTPLKCKCHGLTGTCSLQTCWKVTPPLHTIAQQLRDKYEKACQVTYAPESVLSLFPTLQSTCHWPLAEDDLVFSDPSPNYCTPQPELGSLGTRGRQCDPSADATRSESCRHLCCGRGYMKETRIVEYSCHCRYVYCCHLKCQTCRKTVTNYWCR